MRGAEGGREREGVVRGEDAVLPPHRQGLAPASAGTARARARGRERERERGREGREGKTAHGCCHSIGVLTVIFELSTGYSSASW